MSWQAVRAAFEVEGLPWVDKLVLVSLAYRAGADGRAWPSIARIVADTRLSERAVYYALRRLQDGGHLRVIPKLGTSSNYFVTPAPGAPPPLHQVHPPLHQVHPTPAPGAPRSSKGTDQEHATTGLPPLAPAVAETNNGGPPVDNETVRAARAEARQAVRTRRR